MVLSEKPGNTAGIGGAAEPLFTSLVPCKLAGKPGIVKLTVLKQNVPHLLSIGLLEHAQAVIDTAANEISSRLLEQRCPWLDCHLAIEL